MIESRSMSIYLRPVAAVMNLRKEQLSKKLPDALAEIHSVPKGTGLDTAVVDGAVQP